MNRNVIKKSFDDILIRYPDKIPVILLMSPLLKYNSKSKLLVPYDSNVSELIFFIRNKLTIEPSQALFLIGNNTMLNINQPLDEIWNMDSQRKKFLFIEICLENTFG